MAKSDLDRQISVIHDLTLKMLEAAQKGEWEHLTGIQGQREPHMQSWINLSTDDAKNLSEPGRLQLAEVLEAERRVVELVKIRMESLSGNIREVAMEYKVRKAYTRG
ncbi:MAG: flagellar protein FliT [Pseudomonadota bacterium]|nr:flagellar protein FliT [Pseudomonadota bacterium]